MSSGGVSVAGGERGKPLLIFPCNGSGIEALDCLGEAWRCIGFVDDTPEKRGTEKYGIPVYDRSALKDHPEASVLAVLGSPLSYRSRQAAIEGLGVSASRFATVIHPSARVSPLARIGHNVVIMAGVVLTSNCVIGNHVCILPNTVVHHDVTVGDWSLIGSQCSLTGSVTVGVNCYIGSGSKIMNNVTIGDGALVGIGSNVIRNVAPGTRNVGNPARRLD
jgi:sugar O-acyltransferase (sialic acid O-acetyltransferase NeuD family)